MELKIKYKDNPVDSINISLSPQEAECLFIAINSVLKILEQDKIGFNILSIFKHEHKILKTLHTELNKYIDKIKLT